MKEYSEDNRNSLNEDSNETRSAEVEQEELVHGDNALKGLIPQGSDHFNPIDQDDDDDELDDELDDEDLDDQDEEVDPEISYGRDDEDPDRRNRGGESDIPLEFPDRGPDRNYTAPQADRNKGIDL